ncbi:ABC transporter ATP-binding protein [Vibrio maerlii]|uniref:ABC transporter ATP-binding protein n=1 Tax=Vibrio maerlii TaxID=2231648 RepID=UPI000E3E4051|nr:dipeptide/oligopeptide/nickel ABC transporter ATP-binding protein [Vibrio maerlii]
MHKHDHLNSAQVHFNNVSVEYFSRPRWLGGKAFKAIDQLSLNVETQNLAIVGPSGAGKSTLIELLFGLRQPTSGEVYICGEALSTSTVKQRQHLCKHIQLIPQEPQATLNPYYTVKQILLEPLNNLGLTTNQEHKIVQALEEVGLDKKLLDVKPTSLSVGQAQRVAIARAIVVEPCVLVADEPTSSLDPISRKQVLDLLSRLQKQHQMRLILVTHDLSAANALCDEVMVLDKGQVAEYDSVDKIMSAPAHPTSRALLDAHLISVN